MKIELRKISYNERMSEETNCFVADLYINGKRVGEASNEGHGGCTNYGGSTFENNAIIKEAEAYCKALPKVRSEALNFEYDNSLENVIDEQFELYLKEREGKKLLKEYAKGICYGIPDRSYRTVYWKGRTLASIPLPYLQKAYDEVKAKLKVGEVVLNTNLAELGVKI